MMDFTKRNILMCSKATEIQEAWNPSEGDYCCGSGMGQCENDISLIKNRWWYGSSHPVLEIFDAPIDLEDKKGLTWLPTQSQLQGMIFTILLDELEITIFAISCFEQDNRSYVKTLKSWEQLWLAFVMDKLYQKRWDNDKNDWIKISKE